MAKIEIEIEQHKLLEMIDIDSLDKRQCIELVAKLLPKIVDLEQVKQKKPVPEPQKKVAYDEKNTHQRWSDDGKADLKRIFKLWNGNITQKRLQVLCKKFKRSEGSIKTQIYLLRKKLVKKIDSVKKSQEPDVLPEKKVFTEKVEHKPTIKDIPKVYEEPKPKKKPYKKTEWHTKVHAKAKELFNAEEIGQRKRYGHYLGQASRILKGGDAHTQPEQPPQQEQELVQEIKEIIDEKESVSEPTQEVVEKTVKAFPRIFPLSEVGNSTFKGVCKDLIMDAKRQFTSQNAKYTLNIANEMEWSNSTWEKFLEQIAFNNHQICDFFGVKGSFTMEWSNGSKSLKFKRR